MKRHKVVVDVETNGLDRSKHVPVEVAWHNLATDETGCFIPQHDVARVLADAADDVMALVINRYLERIAGKTQDDGTEVRRLWSQFSGRHPTYHVAGALVGSAPDFDAAMLHKLQPDYRAPWYHHPWDIAVYAAGVLGLDDAPRLAELCAMLDVEPGDHSAERDVAAVVDCYRKLQARAKRRNS